MSAASIFGAHMGYVPSASSQLITMVNPQNETAGPFLGAWPTLPGGWTAAGGNQYSYTGNTAAGTFQISAAGDGTSVNLP